MNPSEIKKYTETVTVLVNAGQMPVAGARGTLEATQVLISQKTFASTG